MSGAIKRRDRAVRWRGLARRLQTRLACRAPDSSRPFAVSSSDTADQNQRQRRYYVPECAGGLHALPSAARKSTHKWSINRKKSSGCTTRWLEAVQSIRALFRCVHTSHHRLLADRPGREMEAGTSIAHWQQDHTPTRGETVRRERAVSTCTACSFSEHSRR